MIINFVGTFNQPGYVGEISDETHLAREMEELGHFVRMIPRDVWREWVLGNYKERPKEIPLDLKSDINIIAKWPHFFDGRFIDELRSQSGSPVFYWVWDFMGGEDWHMAAVSAADLYLGNDVRSPIYKDKKNCYYFSFDVCDGKIKRFSNLPKKYDVVFLGSYLGQGNRVEYLKEINKEIPVKIFSWNFEEWKKWNFDASPALYGDDFNKVICESEIILGFSVEANCWGYWSNRVGKVLRAGGFLLQEYAPGMESLIGDKAEYFNSPQEAIEKIKFYSNNKEARRKIVWNATSYEEKFTSKTKVKELMILCDRYLKGDPSKWML